MPRHRDRLAVAVVIVVWDMAIFVHMSIFADGRQTVFMRMLGYTRHDQGRGKHWEKTAQPSNRPRTHQREA